MAGRTSRVPIVTHSAENRPRHPLILTVSPRVSGRYSEWIATIESGMGRFLDNFLMVRSQQPLHGASGRERYGYLEQNFDRTLLQLFSEV